MPDRHPFLQDLSTSGLHDVLDGPGAVAHHADDRPYGLIEGSVLPRRRPPTEMAWLGTPRSC
jgi:urate oxidase